MPNPKSTLVLPAPKPVAEKAKKDKKERLAEALRQNLRRRKASETASDKPQQD